MQDCVLVLNLGLKSIRAALFDLHGCALGLAAEPVSTEISSVLVEQDADEWWSKACLVTRRVLQQVDGPFVRAVTVTASSSCLVAVDDELRPVHPVIMVSDKRAGPQAAALEAAVSFDAVRETTGLHSDPYLMLPKMLWLKQNRPDVFRKVRWVLSPNDFLIARLAGEVVTDQFSAQKAHYSVSEGRYPVELLRELGLDAQRLPPVVAPGTVVGRVVPESAEALGISPDAKVVVTTYDAIAAFLGSGPAEIGDACDVSGTVTSVRVMAPADGAYPLERLMVAPLLSEDMTIVGASNNLGGGVVEWAKECLYPEHDDPYVLMEREAETSGSGSRGLIFLPYLMGERAPIWDPTVRGTFFGLERFHGRSDMVEAVFESLAFCTLQLVETLEHGGCAVTSLRLSGGLTRIRRVSQLKATVTGREVHVVDDFETTAKGAFLLAAVAMGYFRSLAEATGTVTFRETLFPRQEEQGRLLESYEYFKKVYAAVAALYRERASRGIPDGAARRLTNL